MRKVGRSVSVSAATFAKLKAFCETNHISMSQLVETRVNDFLDRQPENLLDEPANPVVGEAAP